MPKALNVPIIKVKKMIKTQKSPIVRKRLKILLMHAQGHRLKEIRQSLKVDFSEVYGIINQFNKWGLLKLLDPVWGLHTGRRHKLSDDQIQTVITWIGDPNSPGFCFDQYFCTLLCKDIYKIWGVRFGPAALRKRLLKANPVLRKKHFFRPRDPINC
jgi:transposase